MPKNLERLDVIKQEIILNIIVEKTKCNGIVWGRLSSSLLSAEFYEGDTHWDIRLEKIIGQSGVRHLLQIYRNSAVCLSIPPSEELENVYNVIELIVDRRLVGDVANAFMDLPCCHERDAYEETALGGALLGGEGIDSQ